MSVDDTVNFRTSSYDGDSKRPLSTYDNLHANNTTVATINSTDPRQDSEQSSASNINEFPFGDISFRFDELQQRQSRNNNQFTGQMFDDSFQFPHSSDACDDRGKSMQHDYENVSEATVAKPVHSAAKSRFLGLNHNACGDGGIESLENEPLLDESGPYVINRVQIENIPSNSRGDKIDCSDCSLGQCTRHQYEGKGGSMSSAGIDPPTSNAGMKSAKTVTLDNSDFRMNQSFSQAVYMSTTVPQNIKGSNIMGSHTPTRNSLRHSRMLVVNKNYEGARRSNPLNIRHPLLARITYTFHVIVGLIISCLGLWLCWWAPSTRAKENPYWSGLILVLSGILGLILIGFKRVPRHKLRQHFFTFLRINSSFVTSVAAVCTMIASTFAVLHLSTIMSPTTVCTPSKLLVPSSECTCRFGESASNVTISTSGFNLDGTYYRDLSCSEVMGPFKHILIASAVCNFIGFVLCCILLLLLCGRHKQFKRVPYSTANSRNRL